MWGEGRGCIQGSGLKGGLGSLPTLLVMHAGGKHSILFLFPIPFLCSRPFKSGSLVSLYLLGLEFAPTAQAYSYFQSHTVSLHFVAQGEVCTDANIAALQQLGSQVPACLITTKNKIILSGDRGINQPYCVNISQYIHISNHHILHLKLTISYADYISIKLVGKGCYKY